MSDEYTKTVVIRDRSHMRDASLPGHRPTHQNEQPMAETHPSDSIEQGDYPDFEDTSWLT